MRELFGVTVTPCVLIDLHRCVRVFKPNVLCVSLHATFASKEHKPVELGCDDLEAEVDFLVPAERFEVHER